MLFLSAEHRERGSAQLNSFLQRLQKRLHLVYGGRHEWAPWEHNRFSHTKSGGRIWTLLESQVWSRCGTYVHSCSKRVAQVGGCSFCFNY